MKTAKLDFTKDTVIFLDEEHYTTIGVLNVTKIGKTTLSKEIKEGRMEVFRHPDGNLFTKDAVRKWKISRTRFTNKRPKK